MLRRQMLDIKDLSFPIQIDDAQPLLGGVGSHVSGSAQTGYGFAAGTINTTATGSVTLTYGHALASTTQVNLINRSSAYAFGSAFVYDDGAKSHSAGRYGSISSTRG
jgi:hypothetical protein